MSLKGTQVDDKILMDLALKEFKKKAKKKFLSGIKEHNPEGEQRYVHDVYEGEGWLCKRGGH